MRGRLDSNTLRLASVARSSLFAVETAAGTAVAALTALAATLAVALILAHHYRRAGLMLIDFDGHIADHVLVDLGLALQLGDDRTRGVDLEHHVMRLAVL